MQKFPRTPSSGLQIELLRHGSYGILGRKETGIGYLSAKQVFKGLLLDQAKVIITYSLITDSIEQINKNDLVYKYHLISCIFHWHSYGTWSRAFYMMRIILETRFTRVGP